MESAEVDQEQIAELPMKDVALDDMIMEMPDELHDSTFNQHLQTYLAALMQLTNQHAQQSMTVQKNILISEIIQLADVISNLHSNLDPFSQQFISMLRATKPYIVKQLVSRIMQVVEFEIGEIVIPQLYEQMHQWISKFQSEFSCKVHPDAILKCINWQHLAIPIAASQREIGFLPIPHYILDAQCILKVLVDRDESRINSREFKKMMTKYGVEQQQWNRELKQNSQTSKLQMLQDKQM